MGRLKPQAFRLGMQRQGPFPKKCSGNCRSDQVQIDKEWAEYFWQLFKARKKRDRYEQRRKAKTGA